MNGESSQSFCNTINAYNAWISIKEYLKENHPNDIC